MPTVVQCKMNSPFVILHVVPINFAIIVTFIMSMVFKYYNYV